MSTSSQRRSVEKRLSSRHTSGATSRSSSRPRDNSLLRTITDDLNRQRSSSTHSRQRLVLDSNFTSKIEAAILNSNRPLDFDTHEEVTVNGQTGFLTNRAEICNWIGDVPLADYKINEDATPEVIRKQTDQVVQYEQEIAVKYLRPPTPPPPGEIHIILEKNYPTAPAPPLVIRQQPPRPDTPCPLVIREAPPKPPAIVGQKLITISGKRIPPPPRKVVIERLPPLPSKPQSVIIERWLPYKDQKRRVIFTRPCEPDPIVQKPKNVVVQWEQPKVDIKKIFCDLGITRANPHEYVQMYGHELKESTELPSFVHDIRPPSGILLAAEHSRYTPRVELEGDLDALRLIDLDREGLGEYRHLIENLEDTRKTVVTPLGHDSQSTVYANVRATPIPRGATPATINLSQHIDSRPQSNTEFVTIVDRASSSRHQSPAKEQNSSRQQSTSSRLASVRPTEEVLSTSRQQLASASSRAQSSAQRLEFAQSVSSRHASTQSNRPQSSAQQVVEILQEGVSSRKQSVASRPQSSAGQLEQVSRRELSARSSRPQSSAQQVVEILQEGVSSRKQSVASRPQSSAVQLEQVSRRESSARSSRPQSTQSLVQALEEQNLIEKSSTGSRTPSQVGSPVPTAQSPVFFARSPVPTTTTTSDRAPSRRSNASSSRSPARRSTLQSASQLNATRSYGYSPLVEASEQGSVNRQVTSRYSQSTLKNESVSYIQTETKEQTYNLEPSASDIQPATPTVVKSYTFLSTDSVFEREFNH